MIRVYEVSIGIVGGTIQHDEQRQHVQKLKLDFKTKRGTQGTPYISLADTKTRSFFHSFKLNIPAPREMSPPLPSGGLVTSNPLQ